MHADINKFRLCLRLLLPVISEEQIIIPKEQRELAAREGISTQTKSRR